MAIVTGNVVSVLSGVALVGALVTVSYVEGAQAAGVAFDKTMLRVDGVKVEFDGGTCVTTTCGLLPSSDSGVILQKCTTQIEASDAGRNACGVVMSNGKVQLLKAMGVE